MADSILRGGSECDHLLVETTPRSPLRLLIMEVIGEGPLLYRIVDIGRLLQGELHIASRATHLGATLGHLGASLTCERPGIHQGEFESAARTRHFPDGCGRVVGEPMGPHGLEVRTRHHIHPGLTRTFRTCRRCP